MPDTGSRAGFDAWVRAHIGSKYETFTSSVLLLQGKADRLLAAAPKERFEVLAGIVDLNRYHACTGGFNDLRAWRSSWRPGSNCAGSMRLQTKHWRRRSNSLQNRSKPCASPGCRSNSDTLSLHALPLLQRVQREA